jgi:Beta/Gamma crystallin
MFRHLRASVLALTIVSIGVPAATSAATPLVVDLDGTRVSIGAVPSLHCHDLDTPVIRCFETEEALQADLAPRISVTLGPTTARTLAASDPYVQLFQDADYNGASFVVSSNYPNLGTIGWNDKVTSFKGLNGYYGTFYQNASYRGSWYAFGPNQWTNNVGTAWNDQFSSVLRN